MSGARGAETATGTLVVGLGNPIRGDDGVGWRVVEAVRREVEDVGAGVDCLAVGGLALMERLVGTRRAILVDAVTTGHDPAGTVHSGRLSDIAVRAAGHLDSAHDVTLPAALDVARALGAEVPADDEIRVVTVEVEASDAFADGLSAPVAAAVPVAAGRVRHLLALP